MPHVTSQLPRRVPILTVFPDRHGQQFAGYNGVLPAVVDVQALWTGLVFCRMRRGCLL
jgi:hypothetical protein